MSARGFRRANRYFRSVKSDLKVDTRESRELISSSSVEGAPRFDVGFPKKGQHSVDKEGLGKRANKVFQQVIYNLQE